MEIQGSKIQNPCDISSDWLHILFSNKLFLFSWFTSAFFQGNSTTVPKFRKEINLIPGYLSSVTVSQHAKTSTIWIVTGYCRQTMPKSETPTKNKHFNIMSP